MDKKLEELFAEDIGGVERENQESDLSTYNKFISFAKNYAVDTSAFLGFYTPIMASLEYFIAGMESKEVLKSRIYASGYHLLFSRPYGKFRQWYADLWHADYNSSKRKKLLVDTSAMIMTQTPVYSAILYLSGASLKEIAVALPTGLTVGMLSGRPFGYVLDRWRKFCGTKSTLD